MAARMNISVPDKLKRRMDKAKEPVNWSAIASAAFEVKLGEIAQRKANKKMADVIQRLRASKVKAGSDAAARGFKDGRQWATHSAEAPHLQRLDEWQAARSEGQGIPIEDAYGPGEHLYFAIEPDQHGDRRAACDFWEGVVGDNISGSGDEDYVNAFVEGALELWGEVVGEI